MGFTKEIAINSPYEILLIGVANYMAERLGVDADLRSCQHIDEKKIEAFKYQEVIYELAYKGYINYEFSKHFKVKRSVKITALEEKFESTLARYYNKAKEGFFISDEDLRLDDAFVMLRTGPGYDFTLTVMAITITMLNRKFNKSYPIHFVGDNVYVYLREASTLHYYKMLGYVDVKYKLEEKIINTLNANIFKEIGVINGYLGSDLVSYYDKLDMLKRQKISKGSVVYLYKKNQEQLTVMNDIVEDCTLAIVVDYGSFGIKLKRLPMRTSYEYIVHTYENYSDDIKDLYGGLEYFFPYDGKLDEVNLTWTSCGVSYVQNSKPTQMEDYFITNLKMISLVDLPIMEKVGTVKDVKLQAPEAVLFLLLQYQIDFDKDLFMKEYPQVDEEKVKKLVKVSKKNLEKVLGYKLKR